MIADEVEQSRMSVTGPRRAMKIINLASTIYGFWDESRFLTLKMTYNLLLEHKLIIYAIDYESHLLALLIKSSAELRLQSWKILYI